MWKCPEKEMEYIFLGLVIFEGVRNDGLVIGVEAMMKGRWDRHPHWLCFPIPFSLKVFLQFFSICSQLGSFNF